MNESEKSFDLENDEECVKSPVSENSPVLVKYDDFEKSFDFEKTKESEKELDFVNLNDWVNPTDSVNSTDGDGVGVSTSSWCIWVYGISPNVNSNFPGAHPMLSGQVSFWHP